MAELQQEVKTKLLEQQAAGQEERKIYKRKMKQKFADLREAQVKQMCEKMSEEHFQQMQQQRKENDELTALYEKLSAEVKDLQT